MPNNNNYLPKENLAKVEEVREIPTYQPKYTDEEVAKLKEIFIAEQKEKYQIKTSPLSPQARNKVIRKWGSDYVSENKEGYGPCPDWCERKIINGEECYVTYKYKETAGGSGSLGLGGCTCDASSRFCLNIKCYNWAGDGANRYACSTSQALQYAHNLEDNNWYAANVISNEVLHKCATLVREAVRHYDRGNRVKGYVEVQGRFWTGYEWSISY